MIHRWSLCAPLILAFSGPLMAGPLASDVEAMQLIDTVDDYQEVALSPEGHDIAWVKRVAPTSEEGRPGSAIFVRSISNKSPPRKISAAASYSAMSQPAQEADLSWSPNGMALAFLSDARSSGQLQLYVAENGSSPEQLTQLQGHLARPQWSPDGRRIAFLYMPDVSAGGGPTAVAKEETGVAGAHIEEQRLAIVDLAKRQVLLVSPADLYIYDFDWSPDGRRLVATGAHGEGDNSWYVAQLWIIRIADGLTTSLFKPNFQIAAPRWSPNGQMIAFIGGLNSDEGIASGDVYCIPASGGSPRNLTRDARFSAYWLTWLADSKNILFAEAIHGGSGIARLRVSEDGRPLTLWEGEETITGPAGFARGFSTDRWGKVIGVIRSSFDHSSQIQFGKFGDWRPLTPAVARPPGWGQVDNIRWRSDEFEIQGWLRYPADFDATRKYPLVVWVHGGPASLTTPHWPSTLFHPDALLVQHGYFVFIPTPEAVRALVKSSRVPTSRILGAEICEIFSPASNGWPRIVRLTSRVSASGAGVMVPT